MKSSMSSPSERNVRRPYCYLKQALVKIWDIGLFETFQPLLVFALERKEKTISFSFVYHACFEPFVSLQPIIFGTTPSGIFHFLGNKI